MRHVKIVNAGLYDDYAKLNLNTGEIITDNKEKPIRVTVKGTGFNYEMAIRKFQIGMVTDHYLVIILNTKMLKKRYFKGLTVKNVQDVYDEIIGFNLVSFSWEDFLTKSFCTDIDICLDYTLHLNSFNIQLNSLIDATPYSQARDRGYKRHNNGIEWNNRTTATISNPFLKVYDKERELWSRSHVFTERYLKAEDLKDMKRIEFTIKDSHHLMDLNISDTSLMSILEISQLNRIVMLRTVMNQVFDIAQVIHGGDVSGEKPEHTVWVQVMRYMQGKGLNKKAATNYLIAELNTNNKSKYRKKLGALWNANVEVPRRNQSEDLFKMFNFN